MIGKNFGGVCKTKPMGGGGRTIKQNEEVDMYNKTFSKKVKKKDWR